MTDHHKVNIDANNDSKSMDESKMDDIRLVFGTPDSPKTGLESEVPNESDHGRDTRTTNEPDSSTHEAPHSTRRHHPAGQRVRVIPGSGVHDPNGPLPEMYDLKPIENNRGLNGGGTEMQGLDSSLLPHVATNHQDNNLDPDEEHWWTDEPTHFDGDPVLHSRFGGNDILPAPPPPPLNVVKPDVNAYQQRKNLAHGMMDLALLSANANQLRYVIESFSHPYFYPNMTFISLSIILQTAVGLLLILNSQYDVTKKTEINKAIKVNNLTVMGVFIVTILNVFIAAFAIAPPADKTSDPPRQ